MKDFGPLSEVSIMVNGVSPGKGTTEFKVLLMDKAIGLLLLAAGLYLRSKGKGGEDIITLALGYLAVKGTIYTASRTMVKRASVNGNGKA